MQWIFDKKADNDRFGGRILRNKETRGRKLVVDLLVKACPKCERTWEYVNPNKNNGQNVLYYKKGQLPTYGKAKVVCKRCEDYNEEI